MSSEEVATVSRELTRREYQQLLDKRRKRRDRRRRLRIRRLRMVKSMRSLEFWSRVFGYAVLGLCIAFWARFAFVYDIPNYATATLPAHVRAYVTVKPWWFGPPVFNIAHYGASTDDFDTVANPNTYLLMKLGKYDSILEHPQFIWVLRD